MIRQNKKGISHLEIVLSFVIFMGFLIFVISIFKPFKVSSGEEVYLKILEREIENYTSVEVRFLSIKLSDFPKNCFWFNYPISNVIVKDDNKEVVNAYSQEEKIYIDGRGDFYYIYSSDEFKENSFVENCSELENYTLGLFRSYKMISNKSLHELKKEYEDYENLKAKLKLPASKDFVFNVRNMTGQEIIGVEKEKPKTEVLAKNAPIQIVYEDGGFKYAVLNLQVWK